jgi:hypothetical protein
LLKFTKTSQLDVVNNVDTTIMISVEEEMLQLGEAMLQTLALQFCEGIKLMSLNVTVKPGYTDSGTMLLKPGTMIERAPIELFAPAVGGLLKNMLTVHVPLDIALDI